MVKDFEFQAPEVDPDENDDSKNEREGVTAKDQKQYKESKIHLTYMRAMCLKLLKKYHKSEETYISMAKSFNREEGNKIAKYIFGMILMPLETNRKKIMEYVEGFQGILEQYESTTKERKKLI